MKTTKYFVVMIGIFAGLLGCESGENNDAEKMAIVAKMQEKVSKVSADLKAYCDSEMYRKARWKADSILNKRNSGHR